MGIMLNEWEEYPDPYDDDSDEEDWEREDREGEEWECLYPGECVMGFTLHHSSDECHTAEQAREFEREMERENANDERN